MSRSCIRGRRRDGYEQLSCSYSCEELSSVLDSCTKKEIHEHATLLGMTMRVSRYAAAHLEV